MSCDFSGWSGTAAALERHAARLAPSDEAQAMRDRASDYDRMISETPACSLLDLLVKARRLAHHWRALDPAPDSPFIDPLLRTLTEGLDRLRGGQT